MTLRKDQQKSLQMLADGRTTKWAYEKIRARFDSVATPTYGDGMLQWVPDYAYCEDLILRAIAGFSAKPQHILELGAGTGRVSKSILETFADVQLDLVDFSQNMLDEVPNKLGEFIGRYTTQQADFFDPAFRISPAKYDCIVSVFAVCHGQSDEAYQTLYQNIANGLKPGGIFICYDHVLGATDPATALNITGWRHFMSPSLSDAAIEDAIVSTYQEDNPLPLSKHIQFLERANLTADVLYKKDIFAIYTGQMANQVF